MTRTNTNHRTTVRGSPDSGRKAQIGAGNDGEESIGMRDERLLCHHGEVTEAERFWVRGVDLKYPRFSQTEAADFIVGDLRNADVCREALDCRVDEAYQLAADMVAHAISP